MDMQRSFGILAHPTSLPGPWGIGVLGADAKKFVDWLALTGASWWQVLPLGPTGYGDSPYQAVSSFAHNPYLIDPETFFERGWLNERELLPYPEDKVDFGWIYNQRWQMLRRAFSGFRTQATAEDRSSFEEFCTAEQFWLNDYSMYKALKEAQQFHSWDRWPKELKSRQPAALAQARSTYAEDMEFHAWTQWMFFGQWSSLRSYAAQRGVRIIGDIPIFVAHDSPEVWAHPKQFYLDQDGRPSVQAGVPPDYFSETGQLWGNPLYRWSAHKDNGFAWWIERLRTVLKTCDLVRIDHFRGFESYWEVPGDAPNAITGRWVESPGRELFDAISAALGEAPIIAEDLGVITPEVEALRDELGFPGMKVLQFAFDNDEHNPFLPNTYASHGRFAVYPGTHDNETTLGWYRNLETKTRTQVRDYLLSYDLPVSADRDIPWSMLRLALLSTARLAVITMQDVLSLGNEARMNTPSVAQGNWSWRFKHSHMCPKLAARLQRYAKESKRLGPPGKQSD